MSREVIIMIASAVLAVSFHEAAHGYVANYFGDPTAKLAGRLTLNPIKHIDPFGTVLLPLLLAVTGLPPFGYAKPVPVSVNRLRKPRNQSVWVSLAGPGVNLLFVVVSIAVCRVSGVIEIAGSLHGDSQLMLNIAQVAAIFGSVNVSLAAFNLLPIPPLDGSALVERLVPRRYLNNYYQLRARALPFVFVLILLNGMVFHIGGGAFDWLFRLFERLAFPS